MITLKAFAKINLGLRIHGKREDGYHDIETVFHRVNIYDEISLSPSHSIVLKCDNGEIPTDEKNLSVRAAQMLQQAKGVLEGVQIELKKNIPVGAGLGGGSSDAAATLLGLLQLWNVSISEEELYGIAQQIGSDVPYFLKEGTAYATGRGELLEYFDSSLPYWIVVVYPNIKVSTAWVYQNVQYKSQISKPGTQTSLKKFLIENIHTPYMLTHLLQNDLEPIVFRMHPKVTQVKKTLYKSGAVFVQMSGSGSSVYGLFTTEQLAKTTSEKFPHNYNVFLTPPSFKPR